MRTIFQPLNSLLISGTARFASLWRIERTDGVVLRLCDHNSDIVFNGETYSPTDGKKVVVQSASAMSEGVELSNIELRGVISSSEITEADLAAGRYRDATITEYIVDWAFPFAGSFRTRKSYVQETKFDAGEVWSATVAGNNIKLKPAIGEVNTRTCRWRKFGDADCGVNLTTFTQTGRTVNSVSAAKVSFTSTAAGVNGYFDDGEISWTTGANAGLKSEVKYFKSSSGSIELQLETPYTIAVGDTFSIVKVCNRTAESCKKDFNNFNRFGGRPHIPGNDAQFSTPERGS